MCCLLRRAICNTGQLNRSFPEFELISIDFLSRFVNQMTRMLMSGKVEASEQAGWLENALDGENTGTGIYQCARVYVSVCPSEKCNTISNNVVRSFVIYHDDVNSSVRRYRNI